MVRLRYLTSPTTTALPSQEGTNHPEWFKFGVVKQSYHHYHQREDSEMQWRYRTKPLPPPPPQKKTCTWQHTASKELVECPMTMMFVSYCGILQGISGICRSNKFILLSGFVYISADCWLKRRVTYLAARLQSLPVLSYIKYKLSRVNFGKTNIR